MTSDPTATPPAPTNRGLARVCLTLVLALCAGLAARPVSPKLDTWAHAAVGRWIWEHRAVPDHTLFLWSASEPWVAHSWLSQLALYFVVSADGGDPDSWFLRSFTVATIAIPFLLVWRLWARHAPPAIGAAFCFSLAVYSSAGRFQPRPELCTALCLTGLLLFLYRRTVPNNSPAPNRWPRELARHAAVVVMFVLWTNAHGAVAVGAAILAVTAACDLVQDRFDRRSRVLAALALVCTAGTLVNPYGLAYWTVLAPQSSYVFSNIVEWMPVWKPPLVEGDRLAALGLLIVMALVSWVRSPRRRWSQLAWLIGTAAAFLTARRHMWVLSLVCLTVIAVHADALDPKKLWEMVGRALGRGPGGPPTAAAGREKRPAARTDRQRTRHPQPVAPHGPAVTPASRGVVLIALWIGLLLFRSWNSTDWNAPAPRPDRAAQFLSEKHTGGHVLNYYEGSSYLQWRLAGHPPLFIDLLNAYPDQVMLDYKDFALFTPRGKELLDELRIDWVLLTASVPAPLQTLPLVQFLMRSPHWVVVYRDDAAIIWVRRVPETEPVWNARP